MNKYLAYTLIGVGILALSLLGSYLGTTFALNSSKPQTQNQQGFGGQQQGSFQQPQQQQGGSQQGSFGGQQQQGGSQQQQQQGGSTQQQGGFGGQQQGGSQQQRTQY